MMTAKGYLGLTMLFLTPAVFARTPVDETRAFTAGGTIEIQNDAGSVNVVVWDKDEIHVTGMLDRHVVEVEIDVTDGRARVGVLVEAGFGKDISADLTIAVPRMKRLEVEGISASITVENPGPLTAELSDTVTPAANTTEDIAIESVAGDIRVNASAQSISLKSVSGSITFTGTTARLDVKALSGDVVCTGAVTSLTAVTVSGDVNLKGLQQEGSVSATSGDITVAGDGLKKLAMESVSGDVTLEASLADDCRVDATSHSGDVTLRLSNEVSAEFTASTFSGDIRATMANTSPVPDVRSLGEAVHFTTGTGTGVVRVETFSGDVDIRRKN